MNKLSNKNIELIKKFLIDYYKVNTWEECVDLMKFGQCQKLCRLIYKQFPNLFKNHLLNVVCDYSEQAQQLINDDEDMYGNHFLLVCGSHWYDFARGCNCINEIYVLTHNNNIDKYDIEFSDKEKELIIASVKHKI